MRAGTFADKTARRLHGLINKEREKRGLKPLSGRKPLIETAENYSRTMANEGHIGHAVDGAGPADRAPSGYTKISENVAKSHGRDPGKVAHKLLDQWMNSKGHRENILRSSMTYDGIGIWVNGKTVYATHMMAGSGPVKLILSSFELQDLEFSSLPTPSYLSIRQRQLLYGTVYGVLAYQIAKMQLPAVIRPLEFGPIPLLCIAGIVSAESISRTNRLRYLLLNSGVVSIGYFAVEILSRSPISQRVFVAPPPDLIFWALAASSLGGGLLWAARRTPY